MRLAVTIGFLLFPFWLIAQPCGYNNTQYLTWNGPTTVGDSVHASCIWGGEYNRISLQEDHIYRISTCSDNSFDTELSIYNPNQSSVVAYNDDWCGLQSEIYFSPQNTTDYDILVDEYSCSDNSICMELTVELVYKPQRPVIQIPTVVHVLYNNSTQNISKSQIQSQLNVLNEDFQRMNPDISSVDAVFQGRSANPRIEFCLAKRDPQGNPTTGITRTYTDSSGFSTNQSALVNTKSSSTGGKDNWDPDKYLNLYVCNLDAGGLYGIATFPTYPDSIDGVVLDHENVGTVGTSSYPFDGGRSATHEVGHWLYLYHQWVQNGTPGTCENDSVFDTPPQEGANSNCPSLPATDGCTGSYPGTMFMNFMDYTHDYCRRMFSVGQFARTEGTLINHRQSILNSNGCEKVVTCGGTNTLTASSGSFSDGSGSGEYMFNADCKWLIDPPNANSITLSFTSFDTESNYDSVMVYDGASTSAPLLGTFSGSSLPSSITSSGGEMLVHFESDGSISKSGWNAEYCSEPFADVSSDTTICEGEAVGLYASGGSSYSWSPTSDLSCGNCGSPVASPSSTTTYTVTVTDNNGCQESKSVTVTVNSCTSIEEVEGMTDLNIYPNPNQGEFTIDFNSLERQDINITVSNIRGQKVYQEELKGFKGGYSKEVKLEEGSSGIYNLKIHTEKGPITRKVVVE